MMTKKYSNKSGGYEHSSIAGYCRDRGISPGLLSLMTGIAEERILGIMKAEVIPDIIETRKIACAVGVDIDKIYDDRWKKADKKFGLIEKEQAEMEAAFSRHYYEDGSFENLPDELVEEAKRLRINTFFDRYLRNVDVFFFPHSLFSEIKYRSDIYKYIRSYYSDIVFGSGGRDNVDQKIFFIDSRDYDVAYDVMKEANYDKISDKFQAPFADICFDIYNAKKKKIEKEVCVCHGLKNLTMSEEQQKFHEEFLKVYRKGYKFFEIERLIAESEPW